MGVDKLAGAADKRTRVLVADDHPVVRTGLAAVLTQEPDLLLVAQAENGEHAVAMYREHRPDVVLMDLRMPVMDGVEAIRTITMEFPEARILALTTYEGDADIRRALDAGASGYLLKDMLLPDVIAAIRAARRGEGVIPVAVAVRLAEAPEPSRLTERELEVLELVARGLSNKEAADAIGRTDESVEIYLENIFAKLNVSDRTVAVTLALGRGLIHLESLLLPAFPMNQGSHHAACEAAVSVETPAAPAPAPAFGPARDCAWNAPGVRP
jgi:DNA-binding NarL/FixJ family response regulator